MTCTVHGLVSSLRNSGCVSVSVVSLNVRYLFRVEEAEVLDSWLEAEAAPSAPLSTLSRNRSANVSLFTSCHATAATRCTRLSFGGRKFPRSDWKIAAAATSPKRCSSCASNKINLRRPVSGTVSINRYTTAPQPEATTTILAADPAAVAPNNRCRNSSRARSENNPRYAPRAALSCTVFTATPLKARTPTDAATAPRFNAWAWGPVRNDRVARGGRPTWRVAFAFGTER
mmetsp:Transcript_8253/g.30863  ORF Transcript_8253/g.30863 Transcript_8253/m.30863 type:complete len:230 (+) Transcript_8253:2744-3433(+)